VTAAGLRLGGLAFLAGAVLGPIREGLLAPRIGGLAAAWAEGAALAGLLWLAARLALPRGQSARQAVGSSLVALSVVLAAEAALGVAFEASGLAATRAPRGMAEQVPGLLLLGWVALLPLAMRARA
jgi:hypothetical protein